MLYLVIARDSTDPGTPDRRLEVRPKHIEDLTPRVEEGAVKLAGALLGDDGSPYGSALLVEARDEADVREMLERDVYTHEGVWSEFEIHPFRQAF